MSSGPEDRSEPWPLVDYEQEYERRRARLRKIRADPSLWRGAREYYRTRPVKFVQHWGITYDPRLSGTDTPALLPFVPFRRQREFIRFVYACLRAQASGLSEKSRDMGATWTAVQISVHLFLFWPGAAIGWGSRKAMLVDRLGDPDSIFEKIRMQLRHTPPELLPVGFSLDEHMNQMRIVNPETGASVTGEAGDDIGRGGRKLIYFKDEAQPLNARVMTPRGFCYMADMKVGQQVTGSDGRATRVLSVKDRGVHDVYRVRLSDGSSVECSPNHLWTVDRHFGPRKRETLRTTELLEKYRYESPGGQVKYCYRVPLLSGPVEFERRELPLDPYVVGALLGDGHLGPRAKLTSADLEIVDEIRALLPIGVLLVGNETRRTGCFDYTLSDERGRAGGNYRRFGGSRARLCIVAAGIDSLRSRTKFVPEMYKLSSAEDRLSLLQGLMDTDGSASQRSGPGTFCTSSAQLAEDVKFIVQSLGGTTFHCKNSSLMHHVRVRLPEGMCPFRLSRKTRLFRRSKWTLGRSIVDIEKLDSRPVRCISVASPDGLYVTDGCVLTHNSAHYEHPESIEAALEANTNVQIDLSSVGGPGNVFHRRRESGVEWSPGCEIRRDRVNVFVMDWRHHPGKSREWYDERRARAEREGLLHVFAQEVDRDYFSALQGVVISAEWVRAAIDAHVLLEFADDGGWAGALDVADGGGDRNALVLRRGVVIREIQEWGERDTARTARRAAAACGPCTPLRLQYDCVGVGSGVKAEANNLLDNGAMPRGLYFIPWSAGAGVLNPKGRVIPHDKESPRNEEFFKNLKAQGWWELRRRFELTHRAVTLVREGRELCRTEQRIAPLELAKLAQRDRTRRGIDTTEWEWDEDDLISIPSTLPLLWTLVKELSQPTFSKDTRMKLLIDKAPVGTTSPNLADAVMMCYWPASGGPMIVSDELLRRSRAPHTREAARRVRQSPPPARPASSPPPVHAPAPAEVVAERAAPQTRPDNMLPWPSAPPLRSTRPPPAPAQRITD